MKCFYCENQAVGLCKYCLRAVCQLHMEKGSSTINRSVEVLEYYEKKEFVTNFLWCGRCVTENTIDLIRNKITESKNRRINTEENQTSIQNDSAEIICPKCNTLNLFVDAYCKNCGFELPFENELAKCAKCGFEDPELLDKVFCPKCGAPLPI